MTALDTILAFWESKGATPAQAAGIAGNWTVESNLSPTARNAREGAVGVAQWEGGRKTALDRYAASTGGSETDLNTQLGFAWSEMQGSEHAAWTKLLAANDPATAAAVVDQYYERSAGTSRAQRIAAAQAIAGGSPVTVGAAGSVQNAGLLGWATSGWADDAYGIALRVAGGALAGVLVIVGLKTTMQGSSS